jgi:hypothetical protein
MSRGAKTASEGVPAPGAWWAWLRAGASGLLLMTGCVGGPGASDYDPLVDGPPLPSSVTANNAVAKAAAPPAPTPVAQNPAPPPPPSAPIPTAPTTPATMSPAALAAGGDLRIPGPAARPPTVAVAGVGTGAVLSGPQAMTGQPPASAGGPAGAITLAAGTSGSHAGSAPGLGDASYEQLQQELARRGVTWQQLTTVGDQGEWYFVCAIPSPRDAGIRKRFEHKAAGPNGLAAIRAVISKIDSESAAAPPR